MTTNTLAINQTEKTEAPQPCISTIVNTHLISLIINAARLSHLHIIGDRERFVGQTGYMFDI